MSCSGGEPDRSALARSRSIDHQLDEERERRQREIQLLVLGASGSGKSTFIKQMRIKYGDGFPESERHYFKPFIYENITHALHHVLDHMTAMEIDYNDPSMAETVNGFEKKYPRIRALLLHTVEEDDSHFDHNNTNLFPARPRRLSNFYCHYEKPDMSLILQVWGNSGVQQCYNNLKDPDNETFLPYSEEYFLSSIDRILQPGYVPALSDILHIRKTTIGVQESVFTINNLSYRFIDVAGQKSQRKKWIPFFEGVSAVIFFAALSAFDEILEEEPATNSMQDSLQAFSDVVSNKFLENMNFILFLNKEDLFIRKLKFTSLSKNFPQYQGENNPEECREFIKKQFLSKKPNTKNIYTHISCAVDEPKMRNVLEGMLEMIVEFNIRKCGTY
ncbi:guanine nucleotide-binding protein G(i) subunit alpha-2-like [Argonauta hians]